MGLNYLETQNHAMYLGAARKLDKIWTNKFTSTIGSHYPGSACQDKPPNFASVCEDLRPKDKNDIFVWRGKSSGTELKSIKRHQAPLQSLKKVPLKEDKDKAQAETASGKTDKDVAKSAVQRQAAQRKQLVQLPEKSPR